MKNKQKKDLLKSVNTLEKIHKATDTLNILRKSNLGLFSEINGQLYYVEVPKSIAENVWNTVVEEYFKEIEKIKENIKKL